MFFSDSNLFTNREDTGILIQARTTSERLPNKVLLSLKLENITKSVIEWIYIRLKKTNIKKIYYIIPDDDIILQNYLKERSIPYLTGSLLNVRKRYIDCAKKLNIQYVIRVTADNPFVEPELVHPTLKELIANKLDLFSFNGLPLGVGVEVFTLNALENYNDNNPIYEEHVSLHIKKHPEYFKVQHKEYFPFMEYYNQKLKNIRSSIEFEFFQKNLPRLTLDQIEDYKVIQEVYNKLKVDFTIYDVIDLYFEKPYIFMDNLHVQQKKF